MVRALKVFGPAAAALVVGAGLARAEIKTEEISYTHDGTECIGFLAYDDSKSGQQPGVLVLHEWWGLNDYAKERARQLAGMGYVAFAADLYGGGKVTEHPQEAGAMASAVRKNVDSWRGRAAVALDVLRERPECDPARLGVIGYCFGGSTALQLAYSGAEVDAVATFHAALPIPSEADAQAIQAELLINHGAADPFVSAETVDGFMAALETSKTEWTFAQYSGAQHAFSVKGAEKKGVEGLAYNARADRQSWRAMQAMFAAEFSE